MPENNFLIIFMEVKLTKTNFEQEVLKSQIPVLVDFWADWCGPCHMMEPVLKQFGTEQEGKVKIGKLNVDEEPELAGQYQIRSIPNMKFFKNGAVVKEIIGVNPKSALESALSQL